MTTAELPAAALPKEVDPDPALRLALLFGSLYFIQGIGEPVAGLVAQPVRSLLKGFGENAVFLSTFMALVSLPWTLKPIYGPLTDFFPIFGQRRRSYLLISSLLCTASFLALFWFRPGSASYAMLLALLLASTFSIAFSDVVVDGMMIDKGQPRGLTGVLQSVQWASTYAATILTGTIGGYLSGHGLEYTAFLVCAVTALFGFFICLRVREPRTTAPRPSLAAMAGDITGAFRKPELQGIAVFLFLWSIEPLSTTVVYLHMTETMGLSEQVFGNALSMLGVGCLVGSLVYGLFCRRLSRVALAHLAIVLGIVSLVVFAGMRGPKTALFVHVLVGFTWITGSLVQLDLAAQVVPMRVAATVFAVLMAFTNLASSLAEWFGGLLYQTFLGDHSGQTAFTLMIGVSVAVRATCWLVLLLPMRWMNLGIYLHKRDKKPV